MGVRRWRASQTICLAPWPEHGTRPCTGRLVAPDASLPTGELDADLARDVLAEAAGRVGLRRGEIAATWRSGFHFGQQFQAVRGPR